MTWNYTSLYHDMKLHIVIPWHEITWYVISLVMAALLLLTMPKQLWERNEAIKHLSCSHLSSFVCSFGLSRCVASTMSKPQLLHYIKHASERLIFNSAIELQRWFLTAFVSCSKKKCKILIINGSALPIKMNVATAYVGYIYAS